jgi:hypothetical protein
VRWGGYVAYMGEVTNGYEILVGSDKQKRVLLREE